jgi:hypothetical protein
VAALRQGGKKAGTTSSAGFQGPVRTLPVALSGGEPDLREFGPAFWSTVNACEHELLWYYTSVDAPVAERLLGHSIAIALHRALDELAAAAGADRLNLQADMPTCGCRSAASAPA